MGTRMFAIVKDMLKSVYNLNELSLSDMLEAAFEMYPVRVVCADIIAPMMWEIGSMWERGEIMVVMEHFASNVIIAKLKGLLHKQNTTTNAKGPVVIVGCAPEEFHEIGALIVSFFMSLNGWKVVYLGQNVPPTDIMNIVDTMDVHTVAMSASSERSLSALKLIGSHISSRAKKKKVEFLVGGRLLKCGANILESIPAATTRSADDLYAYCPETHPTQSDTMVRGALDGSYSLIRESYRKMRLASERRKRTQYLLDQITDDGAGASDKMLDLDADGEVELTAAMEKMVELIKNGASENEGGPTITELSDDDEEKSEEGKQDKEKSSKPKTQPKQLEGPKASTKSKESKEIKEDSKGSKDSKHSKDTKEPKKETTKPKTETRESRGTNKSRESSPKESSPKESSPKEASPNEASPKEAPKQNTKTIPLSPTKAASPDTSPPALDSPMSNTSDTSDTSDTSNKSDKSDKSDTSNKSHKSGKSDTSSKSNKSNKSDNKSDKSDNKSDKSDNKSDKSDKSDNSDKSNNSAYDMMDIKERVEKQRQQTLAMKEMLKRYKDGKKAAEETITRSRAFLNENRLVSAKKKPAPPVVSPPPEPPSHPPATPFKPPEGGNRLIGHGPNHVRPTTTTFHHLHDPNGVNYALADKDEPYYPKYSNLPRLGDSALDSSSHSSTSMSDDELDDGVD